MQILRDKIKADKKLLVAVNMELTEAEAKIFWPGYEAYQKDLGLINVRIAGVIESYSTAHRNKTLSDEKAKQLMSDFLAVQKAETELQEYYASKLSMVLPPKKVFRYLQIENKIRAVIDYEIAEKIPLVE
jgi:hypothetical protein